MRKRIRCLWHQEETPSLVQGKTGWFCYGTCQKLYTNEEVSSKGGPEYESEFRDERPPEDLEAKILEIRALPCEPVRGLKLPSDGRGYFILWPEGAYYKYRPYRPGEGPKYIGPKGHKPPLFWARKENRQTLMIVEGEINALSVAASMEEFDACSPGSASCFNANHLLRYLTEFKKYSKIIVVLDNDAAGLKGLIESKACFLYKLPFVDYILLSPDPNELLVEGGPQKVREELQRAYRR